MKKLLICLTFLALLVLLALTNSLYVELTELFMMIGALTVISVIYYFVKRERNRGAYLGAATVFGFLFSFIFSVLDIIIDHYLYYQPNGDVDGEPLTLAFTLEEFNEGLFIASVISAVAVLVLTFVCTTIFPKIAAKTT